MIERHTALLIQYNQKPYYYSRSILHFIDNNPIQTPYQYTYISFASVSRMRLPEGGGRMMRYAVVFVLVVTLLIASYPPSVVASDECERLPEGETELIGGARWSPDMRITYHPDGDHMPQVTADADQNAHIVWHRSGLWTKSFDRMGNPLSKEVFISPHVTRGYGSPDRYPLGPAVAIDSNSDIHVTWDDGWQNVYYQKFDTNGNVLIDGMLVGNNDNTASHTPSIAIDPVYDNVHIVHEDYQYQCEDIVYNKVIDGKVVVNAVAVSSDVSSHCEHSTLTTDTYGFIHVAFGTAVGAMWRKVDQNGVARGISRNIFPMPWYKIPDIAVTPNGDVHLVWEWIGDVKYARMDHNGTIYNENVTISDGGFGVGPPRIAAAHDENSVYIVWHDYRYGEPEIFYAKMEDGLYGVTPENHRLTIDPASSLYPRVSLDPDDNVHVVWGDTRDGNSEIYYKFMYHYKMEMGPVRYGPYPSYFHPNQTQELHVYLLNRGSLTDSYRVTLSHDEWAEAEGWAFLLNETEFHEVAGGNKVFFTLTVSSPVEASSGDMINISLTATSLSSSSVNSTLAWRSFILVEKRVTLQCERTTEVIDPGGAVLFHLTVTNIGDVPDTYRIEHTLIPEDKGWEVSLDTGDFDLDVGQTKPLLIILKAPEGAMTDVNGTVFVRVISETDGSVWDGQNLMGIVNPTFLLEMGALVPNRWVDPGGGTVFQITIKNVGTVHGTATIFPTSSEVRPGWVAFMNAETLFLKGGETQVIYLTVTAPVDALAGSRQVIKVTVISEAPFYSGEVEVSAIVNEVHDISAQIETIMHSVHAGGKVRHLMSVFNEGNGLENVALNSATFNPGWVVTFEREGVQIQDIVLLAKEVKSVTVVISIPYDAPAGTYSVPLVLMDETGQRYDVIIPMKVLLRFDFDLSAIDYHAEGPPGGVVSYSLTLTNEGNVDDTFMLEHSGLPSILWDANFQDHSGRPIERVTLSPGEHVQIYLQVQIPKDVVDTRSLDIIARTTSTSAEMDDVKLTLEVKMPDLRFQSVEYNPARGNVHLPTLVTVRVENQGTFRADNVTVVLLENNKEIGREKIRTINERANASTTFSWTPKEERHLLTFQVWCDIPESDYDNNELVHIKSSVDGSSSDIYWVWIAILAVVGIVIMLLGLSWRYKIRAEGR